MVGKKLINRISNVQFIVVSINKAMDGKLVFELKTMEQYEHKQAFSNWFTFQQLKDMFHLTQADEVLYGE